MRKYFELVGTSLATWIVITAAFTILAAPLKWRARPELVATYGGLIAVLGVCLLSVATWRKDKKKWSGDTSDDPFFKLGTAYAGLGSIVWATGESLGRWAFHFIQ
jgi:hypothetical protein